jgi:hypothetical protein
MGKRLALLVMVICCGPEDLAQTSYLNRPDLMELADSCLKHTYNFSFEKALQYQSELKLRSRGHPAPDFLEALIIYWQYFPLTPSDGASDRFVQLMDRSIVMAEAMIENEHTRVEGIFFDLFGRAFKAMYWADNGKPGKVIPDLRTMYNHTKEGFELKDELSEFYFSTGLYNYYIEAYPEVHPVYKPLVSFMQPGNRKLGLIQLNHAIYHTTYLRVEALLFMSIIQLKYENDLNTAALFAEQLHREYPRNIYYQGLLATILLHQDRFDRVRKVLDQMTGQDDPYSEMIRQLAGAFFSEKIPGDDASAGKKYQRTIDLADSFGPMADTFKAMGYMGLSRLYEQKGIYDEARRCARKASNYAPYSFIPDEKQGGSR